MGNNQTKVLETLASALMMPGAGFSRYLRVRQRLRVLQRLSAN
jgi:hypothetical protein